jgi:hypothetical protein
MKGGDVELIPISNYCLYTDVDGQENYENSGRITSVQGNMRTV